MIKSLLLSLSLPSTNQTDLIEEIENWGIKVKLIDPWADKKEIKLIVKTEIDKAIKDFKKLEKQVDYFCVRFKHNNKSIILI